jgi:hypothetical protein
MSKLIYLPLGTVLCVSALVEALHQPDWQGCEVERSGVKEAVLRSGKISPDCFSAFRSNIIARKTSAVTSQTQLRCSALLDCYETPGWNPNVQSYGLDETRRTLRQPPECQDEETFDWNTSYHSCFQGAPERL